MSVSHVCVCVCVCMCVCVRRRMLACLCLYTRARVYVLHIYVSNSYACANAMIMQCPYSARTVPVQCPYSARTVPDLILMIKHTYPRYAPPVCSFKEMEEVASFSDRTHVFPAKLKIKPWSGTVRALYGHCTGTVRALYGHCVILRWGAHRRLGKA